MLLKVLKEAVEVRSTTRGQGARMHFLGGEYLRVSRFELLYLFENFVLAIHIEVGEGVEVKRRVLEACQEDIRHTRAEDDIPKKKTEQAAKTRPFAVQSEPPPLRGLRVMLRKKRSVSICTLVPVKQVN